MNIRTNSSLLFAMVTMTCFFVFAIQVILPPRAVAGEAMDKFELGNKLLRLNRPKSALVFYDKCIKLNPNFYPAYIKRGDALSKMGKKSWARADYKYALKINPRCGEAKSKLSALSKRSSKRKRSTRKRSSKKNSTNSGLSRTSKTKSRATNLAPPTSD